MGIFAAVKDFDAKVCYVFGRVGHEVDADDCFHTGALFVVGKHAVFVDAEEGIAVDNANLAGDFVTLEGRHSGTGGDVVDLDFGYLAKVEVEVVGAFYRHCGADGHSAVGIFDSGHARGFGRYGGGAVFFDEYVVEADVVVAVVAGVEAYAAFVPVGFEEHGHMLRVVVVAEFDFAVVGGQCVCLGLCGGIFACGGFDIGDKVILRGEAADVE